MYIHKIRNVPDGKLTKWTFIPPPQNWPRIELKLVAATNYDPVQGHYVIFTGKVSGFVFYSFICTDIVNFRTDFILAYPKLWLAPAMINKIYSPVPLQDPICQNIAYSPVGTEAIYSSDFKLTIVYRPFMIVPHKWTKICWLATAIYNER